MKTTFSQTSSLRNTALSAAVVAFVEHNRTLFVKRVLSPVSTIEFTEPNRQ